MSNNLAVSKEEQIRYSMQIKLPEIGLKGQGKLKHARVLCIGLGGLGSPLSLYLAGAGIGTLGLVDADEVALDNLHRQILYREAQLSLKKTEAAVQTLHGLNPSIQIHSHCKQLTADNAAELIGQYDIIADGSDNFYTRFIAHDTCFKLNKPYVYAAVSQFQGQCALFFGQNNPCLHCLFPLPFASALSCEAEGVINSLPGLLGMIQATEVIKWILNLGCSLHNRLLLVDLLKMSFKDIQLLKNPNCLFCGLEG